MYDDSMNAVWQRTRQVALALLSEGAGTGEDRSSWIIDVADNQGVVVLKMTLGEALELTGTAKPSLDSKREPTTGGAAAI